MSATLTDARRAKAVVPEAVTDGVDAWRSWATELEEWVEEEYLEIERPRGGDHLWAVLMRGLG